TIGCIAPDRLEQLRILTLAVVPPRFQSMAQPLVELRARDSQHLSSPPHGVSLSGNEGNCEMSFFSLAIFSPLRRLLFSKFFSPNPRSSPALCFSGARTSALPTTSSSPRTASLPPSLMRRLQPKSRLAEIP